MGYVHGSRRAAFLRGPAKGIPGQGMVVQAYLHNLADDATAFIDLRD
jgi:hypothetical protein